MRKENQMTKQLLEHIAFIALLSVCYLDYFNLVCFCRIFYCCVYTNLKACVQKS